MSVESPDMTPHQKVFDRHVCKCQRCSTPANPKVWVAEGPELPKRCPSCKSSLWDTPRKQKRGPKPGTKQTRKPSKPPKRTKRSRKD